MQRLEILLAGVLAFGADERPGVEQIAAQAEALEVEALAAGARGELSLVLLEAPDRGLPLEVRIEASELELDDNRLDWSFVVDPLALNPRVRTRFRAPPAPGRYQVRASVAYSVCDEQWCRLKRGEVQWAVLVE
ncbi:MAG: hypothetical protein R6X02_32065 [Enhygromyxa sp.]